MKPIICATTAALLLLSTVGHARTQTSSFVPRGPQPHSSLSDRHHAAKSRHAGGQGAMRKNVRSPSPKTPGRAARQTPHTN
jgi:hypothetical protein